MYSLKVAQQKPEHVTLLVVSAIKSYVYGLLVYPVKEGAEYDWNGILVHCQLQQMALTATRTTPQTPPRTRTTNS
jgi:hypothetical protein